LKHCNFHFQYSNQESMEAFLKENHPKFQMSKRKIIGTIFNNKRIATPILFRGIRKFRNF
jgi:hypothetical protein